MKLAICFMGHLRTYKQTYESFLENVLKPNLEDVMWEEIDIFIHTWDTFEKANFAWHEQNKKMDGVKITEQVICEVKQIYKPKKMLVETLMQDRGMHLSIERSQKLALEYEKEQNISYDYIMVTRPDLYFHTPLILSSFINAYQKDEALKSVSLPKKHIFAAHNTFGRMLIDDRRLLCEGDLLWFGNMKPLPLILDAFNPQKIFLIPINYILHRDFFLQRENFRLGWVDKDSTLTAVSVIKSHLSYQIGEIAMQCESFKERFFLIFTLAIIKKKFNNQEKINSNYLYLSLCKDYPEFIKIKNSPTYKLGAKIIEIHKKDGNLGLIHFILFKLLSYKKSL
ncbi:hypothetical protein [Campylobacter upsaliensis]|uniref:hypothetical protein n=1 Tax=Campylobacter upsaliensis TaxID=28080 RepID=UPI00214A7B26|nr:hypothetical protein [Campylobacter upsaliensis]MCR2104598.1 hypothetical protein [Campylobacter upsaliensis]MCR2111557.1 hypothetical protein [Campylobacter upsaliensis]